MFAFFDRTFGITNVPSYISLVAIAISLFIFHKMDWLLGNQLKTRWLLIVLIISILGSALRIAWITIVDTQPASDFNLYHQYAVKASQGIYRDFDNTCIVFPQRLCFPFILSGFYRLFGANVLTAKILNVVLSFICCWLIYFITESIFDRKAGISAALFFAVFPSQIMFTSVVASEHLFIFFLLLSVFCFVKTFQSIKYRQALYYLMSGVFLAIAQFIRPVAILLVPAYVIAALLRPRDKTEHHRVSTVVKWVLLGAAYLITFSLLSNLYSSTTGINLKNASMGYNILVGLNFRNNGVFNNDDAQILGEFHHDNKTIHQVALERAFKRITDRPMNFLRLIEKKYRSFWGEDLFGATWSLQTLQSTNDLSKYLQVNKRYAVFVSQILYMLLLLGCIWGAIALLKRKSALALIPVIFFLGHVGAYTFLEVQTRYHMPATILLIPLFGYGKQQFNMFLQTRKMKKKCPATSPDEAAEQ